MQFDSRGQVDIDNIIPPGATGKMEDGTFRRQFKYIARLTILHYSRALCARSYRQINRVQSK